MTTEVHERPRSDLPTGRVTFLFTDIEGGVPGMRDQATSVLGPAEMQGFFDPVAEPLERLDPKRYRELFELGRSMDPEEVLLADDLARDVS